MSDTRDGEIEQVVPERAVRLVILAICSLSLLIVTLDSTIVNVALPAIHRSLHSSVAGLQWVIDAYTLVLAALLMLSGSMGDRLGRRRVFQTGLMLFGLGSLLCAIAPDLGVLIASRALQAIGGSMLNPVALSIVRNVFVDPRERAVAIGVWGSVFGLAASLGPVIGGALVDSVGWRAVFLVNLPLAALAIALTARFVPESRSRRARALDPGGQGLIIAALATITYAIIEGPTAGWLSVQTLGLGAISLICWLALVRHELHRREPLLEVRFFASAPLSGATASAVAMFAVIGGFLFLNTLYLQDARGLSALSAGLYTLPMAAAIVVFAPIAGRLASSRGTRIPLVAGGLCVVAAGLMLTRISVSTSFAYLIVAYVILGVGSGLINPPITNAGISGMPASMAGVAGAVISTGRQTGQTIGVAVFGALAGGGIVGTIGPGFAAATHVGWWIVAGLGALMTAMGLVTSTRWARGTAERAVSSVRAVEPERETAAPAPAA